MNNSISLFALLTLGLLSGCANPGQSYASKHPELSATHRQILATGKVPSGDAIAGMTGEQVKLAMGGYPAVFDKVGGENAWVYVHRKTVTAKPDEDVTMKPNSGRHGKKNKSPESGRAETGKAVDVKTTIFFVKDVATHAEYSEDKP